MLQPWLNSHAAVLVLSEWIVVVLHAEIVEQVRSMNSMEGQFQMREL
jgi:hypothetical protein